MSDTPRDASAAPGNQSASTPPAPAGQFTPPAAGRFTPPRVPAGSGAAPTSASPGAPVGAPFTSPTAGASSPPAPSAPSPASGASAPTAPAAPSGQSPAPAPGALMHGGRANPLVRHGERDPAGAARPGAWDRARQADQLRAGAVGNAGSTAAGSAAGKAAGAAAGKAAAGRAAQAASPVAAPSAPQKTSLQSGLGRQLEQRTRQAANAGAQAAAASTGVGALGSKVAGKAADKAVAAGFKVAAAAGSLWLPLLIGAAALSLVLTVGLRSPLVTGFPLPDAPTKEQSEALPPGWAKVAYAAQEDTKSSKFGVPWTVLAGLLKVQSDFARTAPYDTIDRDPSRDPKYGPAPGMQGSSGVVVSATAYTGPVLVVGTDLTAPLSGVLPSRLPANQVTVDTQAARTTAAGVAALEKKAGSLPGIVVVELGARESLTKAKYGKLVDRAMKAAGENTTVLWFTVHNGAKQDAATAVNQALTAAAARHDNLRLLTWDKSAASNPAFVDPDKVTPTEQGTQARARLVGDAVSGAGSSTGFQMPLKKGTYQLTSPFGMRIHPIQHIPKLHGGLDFSAPGGTPIYAAAAGTVARAGFDAGGFGNLTVIKHEGGLETYYAHQSAFKVKTGDRVAAGQLIGAVGTTGASTGNHLHFEVHVNGTRQDPAKYLPGGANHATNAPPGSEVASFSAAGGTALAAAECVVKDASPAIGGKKDQAVGPFLLRPEHAQRMRDAGKDPDNACEAARYVAQQLTEVGKDVISEHRDWKDDDTKARALWTDVIARANLFSDPNSGNTDCTVPTTGELDVAYAVESIVTCEALRAKAIHVAVSASVGAGGKVSFESITGQDAVAQLVSEALDVSYAFSKHRTDECDNARRLTGIFPLDAATAAKYGSADRCDPQGNIRAAAKALLAGEASTVGDRSTATGPYAPMIGGWAAMPWALGTDTVTLPSRGPRVPWEPTASCDAAIKAWLGAAVTKGIPASGALDAAVAAVPGNPRTTSACASPSQAAFAERVSLLAEAAAGDLADAGGTDTPDEAPAATTTLPTASPTGDSPAAAGVDAKTAAAYSRLAVHFSAVAAKDAPGAAEAGTDSLVLRLSTSGKTISAAPRSGAAGATFTFPTATGSLDHAVYYGGIRPQWDTFGDKVGIVGEVVGAGAGGFAAGGQASVVITAAKKWLGTPYSWGGGGVSGPSKGIEQGANTVGFDCSGLTEYAFAQAGYQIGGTTHPQAKKGTAVASLKDALPGDLIFWGSDYYHVAIYLGDNKIIHAPRTGDVVKIANVYNVDRISAIRRIVAPAASGAVVPAGQWASALPATGQQYAGLFQAAGAKYGVEPQLMAGLAWQESGYRPEIVECRLRSGVGAMGLMQFMPATAAGFGIDPCQPAQAVDAGTKYIGELYRQFGSVPLALAGYNAGPGNVKRYGGVPPFAETQHYVQVVTANCRKLGGRCA